MSMKMITSFEGEYAFLSNFFDSPFVDDEDNISYKTVEHYFQSKKTLDIHESAIIRSASTAGRAKRMGRKCTMRADWDIIKDAVMVRALELKFDQNPLLLDKLVETGFSTILIEGNNWGDTYWGMCEGTGLNKLGKMLMNLRDCTITIDNIVSRMWEGYVD